MTFEIEKNAIYDMQKEQVLPITEEDFKKAIDKIVTNFKENETGSLEAVIKSNESICFKIIGSITNIENDKITVIAPKRLAEWFATHDTKDYKVAISGNTLKSVAMHEGKALLINEVVNTHDQFVLTKDDKMIDPAMIKFLES